MTRPQGHWFPAKCRGYGWGMPRTWQGFLVLLAFFVVLLLALAVATPAVAVVLVALDLGVLLAVVVLTGEPPRKGARGAP